MKKRILSIVLSIVMLVSLLPTTALAADTRVMVGGVEMYSAEGATYYKNGDTTLTGTANDWNAKFDPTTSTLYIKSLSVTGTAASNYAGILSTVDLNIVLEGGNSVTGGDPGTDNVISAGIYASGKNITISGSGTLSATGGAATGTSSSCGIFCDNLTLEEDDIVINAAGGSTESDSYFGSYGIYAGGGGGGMNISAGIVNATGDNIGISCSGGTMYISGSAVINAIGGTATGGASSGISAYTVEISGGTVNAIGGTPASDDSSVGFYSSKNITISGGVINATGGDASAANTSAGIEAADKLTVTDGVLNATGGSAKTISAGIGGDANGNTVIISGGVVVATGGSAGHTSFGHYGSNGSCSIQMSGGVLVARAGAGTNGSVALCEAPELNGARIAGQVAGGSFTGSPSEFNENATAVAIVPSSYTVQNTELTNGNAADYTIATATAVVVNDSTPLSLTAAGSAVTLNGDLVLINLQYETQVPAFYLGTDVTVSGSGTLTAIGAANKEWSYGVAGTGSDLSVNGAKIIAIGGPASTNSYGIGASVNVNVSNNGSVIAIGGGMTADDANSYGIGAGSVSVSGTGEITAVAGMGKTSAGINGKLNAGDTATVTAVGGVSTQANGNSYGIYGATTVQGSATVNALGGAAINSQSTSFGISGAVTVGGGTVNAVGNTAKIYSYGIGGLLDGAISITAGTVNAVGGIAGETSFGIQSGKRVSVSAGSAVNAVGRTYGLRTASGTLAGGNFAGGSKAVSISDDTSNVNALLADGCGYFTGSTQLTPGNSDPTVGDPYQVVTVKEIPIPHVHPVCGAEHTNIGDHTSECGDITWTALSTVLTYDSESDTYKGALSSGNYYLDKDMTVKGTRSNNNDFCIDIQGTAETSAHVNICLNGHQLKGSSGDVILHVSGGTDSNNASLSICDCYDAATHTGAEYTHTYTSPISGEEKTVTGGLVTGAIGGYARTMYANCAQVNIYGGTFAGNGSGKTGGGALYMSGAVLRFYDGSITDNYVSSGGMLSMQNAEAHLIGGSVTGNAAYYGVTGNYEDDGVGGVHLFGESTAAIHSGFEISGNKAGLGAGESIDSNLLLGVKPTENSDLYITLIGPMDTPIGIRMYEPGVFTNGFGTVSGASLNDFICEQRGYFLATEGEGNAAEAKLEPYAITTQPTTDTPKVTTNKDSDIASYSWHSQESAVVDKDSATALTYYDSICTDGVWSGTPQGSGYEIYFFTMELNAGDTLTATLVNDDYFDRITLEGENTDSIVFSKNEAPYVFEIPANDTYALGVAQAVDANPTFSVTRSSVGSALDGQTTATLTGGTDRETYVCKVTFEDGTVLVSDPVEYEAPVHNHSWTYAAEDKDDDGKRETIVATCNGGGTCEATNKELTIYAPLHEEVNDGKSALATLSADSIGGIDELPSIQYHEMDRSNYGEYIGDPTTTAPTKGGKFEASITVAGQKASVVYLIEKLDREDIKQFTVSYITNNSFVITLHEDDWGKTDFVCEVGGDYIDFTPDENGKATITVPEIYAGHSNLRVYVYQKETDTHKKSNTKDTTISLLPAPATYTMTYDANGATNGTVLTDSNSPYNSGATVTVLGNTGNLEKTDHTFAGWNTEADGSGTTYAAGETFTISANTTLYAKWTANTYSVTLNTNGATIADGKNITSYTYGVGATLPAAGDMTKASHRFDGWYESADFSGSPVTEISTTATGDKTYYAKWTEVHTASGTITGFENTTYTGKPTAKLVALGGSTIDATVQTKENGNESNGPWTYSATVPAGQYNLVVTATEAGEGGETVTVTALVDLTAQDTNRDLTLPTSTKSSTVKTSNDETPKVIAGGVDEIAKNTDIPDGASTITIKLTVDEETEDAVSSDAEKIESVAGGQTIDLYLDIQLTLYEDDSTNGTDLGSTNTQILELLVPADTNKAGLTVYRVHNGVPEAMKNGSSDANGEYFKIGDGFITIYAKKFSVYAIGYTPENTYTITLNANGGTVNGSSTATLITGTDKKLPSLPTPVHSGSYTFDGWYTAASGGTQVTTATEFSSNQTIYAQWTYTGSTGGGGGDYTPTYAITVGDAENGEVKANRSYAASGSTVTITVTPEDGYALYKLTVTDSQGNKIELTDKGDGTFTFKMSGRKVMIEASFVDDGSFSVCPGDHTCPIWPYTDAEATAWYHDGVHYCIENGLMTGYGNGIFKPNADTTRAMITVMLWRLNGSPVVNYLLDFEDVEEGQWYTEAIRWAKSEGIATGYGNGCFGTNDAITREQMVTILWRYAQYKGIDVSVGENTNILSYNDAFDVAEYAIPAMQWACGSGMVQGMNDPNGEGMILAPESKGTRAQIATMMMRFCTEIVQK